MSREIQRVVSEILKRSARSPGFERSDLAHAIFGQEDGLVILYFAFGGKSRSKPTRIFYHHNEQKKPQWREPVKSCFGPIIHQENEPKNDSRTRPVRIGH